MSSLRESILTYSKFFCSSNPEQVDEFSQRVRTEEKETNKKVLRAVEVETKSMVPTGIKNSDFLCDDS